MKNMNVQDSKATTARGFRLPPFFYSLLAISDHLEAVIPIPDVAPEKRRTELHHHVPAHRHDIGFALPG